METSLLGNQDKDPERRRLKRIFALWRDIECLTPFDVREDTFTNYVRSQNQDALTFSLFKWDDQNKVGKYALKNELDRAPSGSVKAQEFAVYTVLLGVIPRKAFIRRLSELLSRISRQKADFLKDFTFEETFRDEKITLGMFRLNHFSKYVEGSLEVSYALAYLIKLNDMVNGKSNDFSVSEFAECVINGPTEQKYWPSVPSVTSSEAKSKNIYSMSVVRKPKDRSESRLPSCMKLLEDRFPERSPQDVEDLENISKDWLEAAGLDIPFEIWVSKQTQETVKELELPFMNSPYVHELDEMILRLDNRTFLPHDILSRITETLLKKEVPVDERRDIFHQPRDFIELADPRRFNLGRWPHALNHYLDPLQQAAVSEMCSIQDYEPLISVNGPPGTGKTTIVKELVAHVVVARAYRLAQIPDILTAELFDNTRDGILLKKEFSEDFSILVASNNNNAVENISKELPYSYGYDKKFCYFPAIADKVNHTEGAWGFISLALGKRKNWETFFKMIFRVAKNPQATSEMPSRKTALEVYFEKGAKQYGSPASLARAWEEEKKRFSELLAEVQSGLEEQWARYNLDRKEFFRENSGGLKNRLRDSFKDLFFGAKEEEKEKSIPFEFCGVGKEENLERRLYGSEALDRKRTELFLSALQLHRLTILLHYKKYVRALTVSCEKTMLNEASVYRSRMLGTICFLVPLISTTFASAVIRFGACTRKSLPWVIVDEASQATPQSTLCLMQRAKRMIVLGDPSQLDPVVSLPRSVIDMLIDDENELTKWVSPLESLQTIADRIQRFGTLMESDRGKVWTGIPLRLQRRSFPPMFMICNGIAYSGQMTLSSSLLKTYRDAELIPSFWLDVRPRLPAETNRVTEELDAMEQLILRLDEKVGRQSFFQVDSSPKTLMVCTPFRAVEKDLYRRLKNLSLVHLTLTRSGTIHSLQGRQADMVIVVLGSKTGAPGAGARRWASSPSNLWNVAISRAKESVFIIGNFSDWSVNPVISEIIDGLERFGGGIVDRIPFEPS